MRNDLLRRPGLLYFFFLLLSGSVHAQNLVLNPSFELHSGCPGTTWRVDEIAFADDWHSARLTPDYIHSCGDPNYSQPSNIFGTQLPATGDAYAQILAYSPAGSEIRELMTGKLSQPMTVGMTYLVSYKVSLAENSFFMINGFGMHFYTQDTGCYSNIDNILPCSVPLTNTPHLITYGPLIDEQEGWHTLRWEFIADQPYTHLVLGIFSENISVQQLKPLLPQTTSPANYFIDDVEVIEKPACEIALILTHPSCHGDSNGAAEAVLTTTNTHPISYNWLPAPLSLSDDNHIHHLRAGTYKVIVQTGEGQCQQEFTIIDPPEIAIEVSVTNTDCGEENGTILLDISGGTGNFSTYIDGTPVSSNPITGLKKGTYAITAEDEKGCHNSRTVIIENKSVELSLTPLVATIQYGDSILLSASGTLFYEWDYTSSLSCTNCNSPYAHPVSTTVYSVTGYNSLECKATLSAVIYVNTEVEHIFIPSVFSPNSDGVNDEICIIHPLVENYLFSVYNRWGEKIFESSETQQCWDGSFKNALQQTGTYVYKLTASFHGGKQLVQSGNISLIR